MARSETGLPGFRIPFKLLAVRESVFRRRSAGSDNRRQPPFPPVASRHRTTVASLRMSTATSVVRKVRRRTGYPRIGARSGMARQAIARRRLRAPQTSLTGRVVDPPARDGDARDELRRPATVRLLFVEVCRASPAIRREFSRDAADGRSGDTASTSGRRGPARASMCAPGFAPARSSDAATLSIGRAVRRSERMSATPPLSRAEPVASGSLRGVRSIPLRGALREFFGLGAPDASLISKPIRIGSNGISWLRDQAAPAIAGRC